MEGRKKRVEGQEKREEKGVLTRYEFIASDIAGVTLSHEHICLWEDVSKSIMG